MVLEWFDPKMIFIIYLDPRIWYYKAIWSSEKYQQMTPLTLPPVFFEQPIIPVFPVFKVKIPSYHVDRQNPGEPTICAVNQPNLGSLNPQNWLFWGPYPCYIGSNPSIGGSKILREAKLSWAMKKKQPSHFPLNPGWFIGTNFFSRVFFRAALYSDWVIFHPQGPSTQTRGKLSPWWPFWGHMRLKNHPKSSTKISYLTTRYLINV